MSFSFNYPNTPYYLPTSSVIDISRVVVGTEPTPVTYIINQGLPYGLSIDPSNGRIFGNTYYQSITINGPITYTIDASYSDAISSTTIIIGVSFLPVFSYPLSPYIKQENKTSIIAPVVLISNIQGIVYTVISSPPLSDISMNIDSNLGIISGTPNPFSQPTNYIIRANNAGLIYDTSLIISIQPIPTFTYSQSTYILTQGITVNIVPTVTSNYASVITYSIDGCALPNGLFFNTTTGAIFGTPLLPTSYRQYTVKITNIIGSSTLQLILNVIKVLLAPPVVADNINAGLCLTNPIIAMRRKAEILKYKNNSSSLTRNQQLSLAVQGNGPYGKRVWANQNDLGSNPNISGLNSQGNTIICNTSGIICAPNSASDVPGPVTTLCYNPAIPLMGYGQPNRTRVNIGFKWPQRTWQPGDMGFPIGKAGSDIGSG
jgi:hypothetical protein